MRVHELAKEFGVASKDLINQIRNLGQEVKTHMSVVNDDIIPLIRKVHGYPAKVSGSLAAKTAVVAIETPTVSGIPLEAAAPRNFSPDAGRQPAHPVSVATVLRESEPQTEPSTVQNPKVVVRFPITVGVLSETLKLRIPDVIKALMSIGVFANVNQLLNEEIGFKAAHALGIPIEKAKDFTEKLIEDQGKSDDIGKLKVRAPVVTMMGHVDHGKTSLLDAIRKTNVASREKGHITQHMGAYGVDIPGKGHVTFLDTPGHEAFTAMRARGANATDVVVLVVAADDGVMPQTTEALAHAREAGCPIVVALNKVDLPNANLQKVMMQLQKLDLAPEEWGGKTICVKVSAKTGQGIEQLLDLLLLEAEVLELKANPDRAATGTVIEGHLSRGSGAVATVIVQNGTLRVGDIVLCGPVCGRVRALRNHLGKAIQEVPPGHSAELSGLDGVADAGEKFFVLQDERAAKNMAELAVLERRERLMRGSHKHLSLEDLYHRLSEGNFKELKIIAKSDVQGSVEALAQSLEKILADKCRVRIIHGGVGGINESDVMLAAASDAIILGFHVKADLKAQTLAEKEGVDIRYYNIIYEAVEDVSKAMEGLLEPVYKEVIEGRAHIRKIFKSSKAGAIGGAMVTKGKITRSHSVRVLRDHIVVFDGKLAALKRFKDDVREVAEGYECGFSFQGFDDIREDDLVESYRQEKIAAKL